MYRKIFSTIGVVALGMVCMGSSCQQAARDMGKVAGDVTIASGGSHSDAQKFRQGTELVAGTVGQSWNERDIGEATAVSLTASPGLVTEEALNNYVSNVGITVASVVNRPDIDFTFGITNDNEVNALSAPTGFIFISRGALAKMQDESELAAVLAHEIAHVVKNHGMEALRNGRFGSLFLKGAQIASDDQMVDLLAQGADDIKGIIYNPQQESDADALAVKYLKDAGYDPSAMTRFLQREMASAKTDLRSHPPTADRVKKTQALVGPNPTGQKNAERYKQIVKPR